MITAVCLNPSIDHTLRIDGFEYGGLNRVRASRFDAGGKGVNVAVAVSALGYPAECVGFMYRESARLFETRLIQSGASCDFAWREGSARTNLKVFDAGRGVVTEFNESGRPVDKDDLAQMTQRIVHRAEHAECLVLSGSMPPGCPKDYYAQILRALAGKECRCVLDADGEALREGIKARPWLIKPNRAELEALTGRALTDVASVRVAAREIVAQGVSVVAVSMGAQGALIADAREAFYAPALKVPVRSTVGAGDAMVAGLAVGFATGAALCDAFGMGMAAASAMCMTEGSAALSRADYMPLVSSVQLERI